ncbi:MAG TPA: hypothetical protein VF665_20260 [Longimicrobium sp.]|uniref:MutS-related protein n=1 Tax=Longimicrobium sp. TaxID=2029185 RepID=UPI002EDAA7FA
MPSIAAAVLAAAVALVGFVALRNELRARAAARAANDRWGAPRERPGDLALIAPYHHRRLELEGGPWVDDGTWDDLDGDELFAWMDHTRTVTGQQFLYHQLRTPLPDPAALRELDDEVRRFADDPGLRRAAQRALVGLQSRSAAALPNLFLDELPPLPRGHRLFPLLPLAAALGIALFFVAPPAGAAVLGSTILINLTLQQRHREGIAALVEPVRALRELFAVADALAAAPGVLPTDSVEELRAALARCDRLRRTSGYLRFESPDELAGSVVAYVNVITLLDVNAYALSAAQLVARTGDVRLIHETVGRVDAPLAVASWRAGLASPCTPELVAPQKRIEVHGLRHPLLPEGTPNDLRLDDHSLLITGSNASGKTTFIRALALNAILAQTMYTCTAAGYRAPVLAVRSFIGRRDDLMEGRSYFQAEVHAVGELLAVAATGPQHLFVLDEIFRGTNTVERVAAARGVLEYLNAGPHLVMASTHDLELLDLLGDGWEFWHFREEVQNGELCFDYLLRPGAASTRNALTLLEFAGYPAEVVRTARATADRTPGRVSAGPE